MLLDGRRQPRRRGIRAQHRHNCAGVFADSMDQWDGREMDVHPAWMYRGVFRVAVHPLHHLGEEVEGAVDREIRISSDQAGIDSNIIFGPALYIIRGFARIHPVEGGLLYIVCVYCSKWSMTVCEGVLTK